MKTVTRNLNRLETLQIPDCAVTDRTLGELARNCPNLASLDVSTNCEISVGVALLGQKG
jgi:hypothetical protein